MTTAHDYDPEIYYSNNYVVLDFETTNEDKGDPVNRDNAIILAVWKTVHAEESTLHVRWGNEYELADLVRHCEEADFIVAHGGKFECGWLLRCGVSLEKILLWDTLIYEYVDNLGRKVPLGLDAILKRRGIGGKEQVVSKMIKAGINPLDIPEKWLQQYCIQDVEETHKLFLQQRLEARKKTTIASFYAKCLFTLVLTDIESNGICLDPGRVGKVYEDLHIRYEKNAREIDAFTGGINPRSSRQVADFLYNTLGFDELKDFKGNPVRTNSGNKSTSRATITRLKARNKRQRRFIELKKEQSQLEKAHDAVTKFKACVDEAGGIIYAGFNQTVTATGRLSSSGKRYKVQLQNLDRNFRPLFSARREGWQIIEADGPQLEFRTAAFCAGDKRAYEDIMRGEDVHRYTASVIYDKPPEDITDAERTPAKAHTFKPLYGGESGSPRERAYYLAFREKYPEITEMQLKWEYEVLSTGRLKTVTGVPIYYDNVTISRKGYINRKRDIYNYPIQYFATSEIIPISVINLWYHMKQNNMKSFLVNTVHDSVVGEVSPEEVELYEQLVVQSFTEDTYSALKKLYDIDFDLPLDPDFKAGSHWGTNPKWEKEYLTNP